MQFIYNEIFPIINYKDLTFFFWCLHSQNYLTSPLIFFDLLSNKCQENGSLFFVLTADVKNLNNGNGRQNDKMKTKKKHVTHRP